MLYKALEKTLKIKLSGSMNYHLSSCDLDTSDIEIIQDFLRYSLYEEDGTYSYLDKKSFEYIDIDLELKEDLVEVLKERLKRKRAKRVQRVE